MNNNLMDSKQKEGVTFDVCDVPIAESLLPTIKTHDAIRKVVGGKVEAVFDYHSECCANVATNPLITAAKLAHDQHRPLVLSPDMIWLSILQGLSIHVEENRIELKSEIVKENFGGQLIEVSTEDFPFGSPESPWAELVDEAAQSARRIVCKQFADLFQISFSTTDKPVNVAMDLAFLSAVNAYISLYDNVLICGIPQITLEGRPDDWQEIRSRVDQLDRFGLGWWTRYLREICDQFVSAAKGKIDLGFWRRIYQTDSTACTEHDRITGWIGRLFPFVRCALTGGEPQSFLRNRGQPSRIVDFPFGLRSVLLKSQRETTVRLLGGFVGIAQENETGRLRPKIGWAVQRLSGMDYLLEKVRRSRLCDVRMRTSGNRLCFEIEGLQVREFYQRFAACKIATNSGDTVCEFHSPDQIEQMAENPKVYLLGRLSNNRFLAVWESCEIFRLAQSAFFIVNRPDIDSGKVLCEFIGDSFEEILNLMIDHATNGDTEFHMPAKASFDLRDKRQFYRLFRDGHQRD